MGWIASPENVSVEAIVLTVTIFRDRTFKKGGDVAKHAGF